MNKLFSLILFTFLIQVYSTKIYTNDLCYEWECVGPINYAGVVKQIVVDPHNSNRIFCGTWNGGLWVLNDFKDPFFFWRPLTDNMPNLRSRAVALSVSAPGRLYWANGIGELYRSDNYGENFIKVSEKLGFIKKIIVHPKNADILYVAICTGIKFKQSNDIFRNRFLNTSEYERGKLIKSTDGGLTWQSIGVNNYDDYLDIQIDDSGTIYTSIRNSGIWRISIGETNWTNILNWEAMFRIAGDLNQMVIMDLQNTKNPGLSKLVVKVDSTLFISENSGTNWNHVSVTGLRGGGAKARTDFLKSNEWCNLISISPYNHNEIYVGGVALKKTSNNGSNWFNVAGGHEDYHVLTYDIRNKITFVGNDGGIFYSTNNGINWDNLNRGLINSEIKSFGINKKLILANVDHNSLQCNLGNIAAGWKKSRNNRNENNYVVQHTKSINSFFIITHNSGCEFFVPQERTYSRTNFSPLLNVGQVILPDKFSCRPYSYNIMPVLLADFYFLGIDYVNNSILQVPDEYSNLIVMSVKTETDGYGIYTSREGNIRPNTIEINTENNPIDLSQIPEWKKAINKLNSPITGIHYMKKTKEIFALSWDGVLYFTNNIDNNNQSWDSTGISISSNQLVQPRYGYIGLVGGISDTLIAITRNSIVISTNKGLNWISQINSDVVLNQELSNIIIDIYKPNTYYLGAKNDVFVSYNGGFNWESFDLCEKLPNANILKMHISEDYLYVCTYGRGIWRKKIK